MKKYLLLLFFFGGLNQELFSQCYSVNYIPYTANPLNGSFLNFGSQPDDIYSAIIPIGFSFCFYGNVYDRLVIGSNGVLSFDTIKAGAICPYHVPATPIPDPGSEMMNAIMFPWIDLSPEMIGGNFRYLTVGTSPNRSFFVTITSCSLFQCDSFLTSRVVLYESSNVIEVDVHQKQVCPSWNGGRAFLGIQNSNGSLGLTDTVVTGTSEVTNVAVLFTPLCDVCLPIGINEIGSYGYFLSAYPNPAKEYVAVNVNEAKGEIRIYDFLGRQVMGKKTENEKQSLLNISTLPAGMYVLQFNTTKGNYTSKFVKE